MLNYVIQSTQVRQNKLLLQEAKDVSTTLLK